MAKKKSKAVDVRKVTKRSTGDGLARQAAGTRATSDPESGREPATENDASRRIDERIQSLGDWRGATLATVRALIHKAEPKVSEQWKWKATPVWEHEGIVCTGETYKQVVKLTFARGAALPDPHQLFNASLEGTTRRAIDLREGDSINQRAFQALVKAAVAENLRAATAKAKSKPSAKRSAKSTSEPTAKRTAKLQKNEQGVVLLSGGNPQIAKADGDAPVQAYIAAMPGWKSQLGARLDALIMRAVPDVRKAVRWNSPFYGAPAHGWFLSFHVFTRYVKVTFFDGMSLRPIPPGGTERSQQARWIDIYEHDPLDEGQMLDWIQQAAHLPGWTP